MVFTIHRTLRLDFRQSIGEPENEVNMLEAYRKHVEERATQGIPPLPLNAEQVNELVLLLKNPPAGEEEVLVDLLTDRCRLAGRGCVRHRPVSRRHRQR